MREALWLIYNSLISTKVPHNLYSMRIDSIDTGESCALSVFFFSLESIENILIVTQANLSILSNRVDKS